MSTISQKIRDQRGVNLRKTGSMRRPQTANLQTSKINPKTHALANFNLAADVQQINSNLSCKPRLPKSYARPTMTGTNQFHQHRPTRADEIQNLQEYNMFGNLKRSHEKEIAAEQNHQLKTHSKNYYIKTGKPDMKSELSKKTDQDEKKRLEYNYKMKMPYTKLKYYEQKYGKKPQDIEAEIKQKLQTTHSEVGRRQDNELQDLFDAIVFEIEDRESQYKYFEKQQTGFKFKLNQRQDYVNTDPLPGSIQSLSIYKIQKYEKSQTEQLLQSQSGVKNTKTALDRELNKKKDKLKWEIAERISSLQRIRELMDKGNK